MKEQDFSLFVEVICKRPGLYTPTGSFFELVSFLEGYGGAALEADGPSAGYHSPFTPFLKWAAERLSVSKKVVNWKEFRERFDTDMAAITGLISLYKEFSNEDPAERKGESELQTT